MLNFVKPIHQLTYVAMNSRIYSSDRLNSIRQWLNQFKIDNTAVAHLICQLIPAQCPFERRFSLFGRIPVHIPPLCKLNPFYEEFVGLRFRALSYLADECHKDVRHYC